MVATSTSTDAQEIIFDAHGDFRQRTSAYQFRKLSVLLTCIVISVVLSVLVRKQQYAKRANSYKHEVNQEYTLDGCKHIYIDLGTNIGIQIRKVYEPNLYPGATVIPLFDKIFGKDRNDVCSVGFEANPAHDKYLEQFENYCFYNSWRVKIYKSTAVSFENKNVSFYTEPGDTEHNQWGASLLSDGNKQQISIFSIDIAAWFKSTVLARRLPKSSAPKIMMKIDIEGHDTAVLMHLMMTGVYCSIDLIYAEHVHESFLQAASLIQKSSPSCKTELIYLDDESFYNSRFPFVKTGGKNSRHVNGTG